MLTQVLWHADRCWLLIWPELCITQPTGIDCCSYHYGWTPVIAWFAVRFSREWQCLLKYYDTDRCWLLFFPELCMTQPTGIDCCSYHYGWTPVMEWFVLSYLKYYGTLTGQVRGVDWLCTRFAVAESSRFWIPKFKVFSMYTRCVRDLICMHTKLEANYSCKCAQCTVNITSTATNDTVSWKL